MRNNLEFMTHLKERKGGEKEKEGKSYVQQYLEKETGYFLIKSYWLTFIFSFSSLVKVK